MARSCAEAVYSLLALDRVQKSKERVSVIYIAGQNAPNLIAGDAVVTF
jgi:metal-dependent amidase/aminoacylase/carboxypeptidase family protein